MKKDILVFSFVFLIKCDMMAQKQDSIPARSLAEKGALGDVHLGNELRKDKLLDAPQRLPVAGSSPRTDIHSKKKKSREDPGRSS